VAPNDTDDPNDEQFDDGPFLEVAVNGRSIARISEIDDALMSDIDDAVLSVVLRELADGIDEEVQEEYDADAADLVDRHDPDVRIYESEDEEWESIPV
jgi:hypothetical protein